MPLLHPPAPPETRAECLRLRAAGLPAKQVAERLGVSEDAVWKWCQRAKQRRPAVAVEPSSSQLPTVHRTADDREGIVLDEGKETHELLGRALRRAAEMSVDCDDYDLVSRGLDRLARVGKVLHRYGETSGPQRVSIALQVQFQQTEDVVDVQALPPVDVEPETPSV